MALIITRRAVALGAAGEKRVDHAIIRIGDDIVVKIIDITGNNVRIAIEAPKAVSIHRGEVYRKIAAQRQHLAPIGDENAANDVNSH